MNVDATFFVLASGLMTLIFLGLIYWGYKDGQFKDLEKTKFDLWKEEHEK